MGTNEYSQPASKSSWDSQDFGDVNMVVEMAHFHKSSRPQWVKHSNRIWQHTPGNSIHMYNATASKYMMWWSIQQISRRCEV